MKNLLSWGQRTSARALMRQELKGRILKSREAVIEVFSQNMEGVKPCPILLGEKCMGKLCTFFLEFKSVNHETGEEKPFWRCTFVETPMLLIELNRNIQQLRAALERLLGAKSNAPPA